jgi:hypothetical protein
MALQKLQFKPGIVRDTTDYTNEGGWFDCDKVRFRMGLPETIGGWAKFTTSTMLGTCRSLHVWSSLTGTNYVGAGTSKKFYIVDGSEPNDITPIRLTTTGTATFCCCRWIKHSYSYRPKQRCLSRRLRDILWRGIIGRRYNCSSS